MHRTWVSSSSSGKWDGQGGDLRRDGTRGGGGILPPLPGGWAQKPLSPGGTVESGADVERGLGADSTLSPQR